MKKLLLMLALLCLYFYTFCQQKKIKFISDQTWEQIKSMAKAQNKFIFMDVYATWCVPCKWMDQNVYSSNTLGDFMNDRFISVKVQIDTTENDSEMIRLWRVQAQQIKNDYNINALPTFLFYNQQGVAIHKFKGLISDTSLIKLAAQSLDLKKQYYIMLAEYKDKKMKYNDFPDLIRAANSAGETTVAKLILEDYTNNYLFKIKESTLMTYENLSFLNENFGNTYSHTFNFFFNNKAQVNTILGPNKAEYAIRSAIARDYKDFESERPNWDLLEKEIVSRFGQLGQELVYGKRMSYYLKAEEWENFGKYYVLYFKTALERPEYNINMITWPLFLNITDSGVLDYATNHVMKYAMEEWYQNDFHAYDTYANLLYKIGRTEAAIEWEERAVKNARGGPKENVYLEVLQKMKKGERTW